MSSLRAVFVGGTESGLQLAQFLDSQGVEVVAVISWHPSKSQSVSGYADFSEFSSQRGIPNILVEGNINSPEVVEQITRLEPDLMFVLAWGQLLQSPLLGIPKIGTIGRHNALLPFRRGRAPVAWALIDGLKETGVSLFWMDPEVDNGDILGQRKVTIDLDDYANDILRKLNVETEHILEEIIPLLHAGQVPRIPQDKTQITYTHPRRPDMGLIDWEKSAFRLYNFIRGLSSPYPGAFTYQNLRRVNNWRSQISRPQGHFGKVGEVIEVGQENCLVQTGDGTLEIPQPRNFALTKGDTLG